MDKKGFYATRISLKIYLINGEVITLNTKDYPVHYRKKNKPDSLWIGFNRITVYKLFDDLKYSKIKKNWFTGRQYLYWRTLNYESFLFPYSEFKCYEDEIDRIMLEEEDIEYNVTLKGVMLLEDSKEALEYFYDTMKELKKDN